MNKFSFSQRTLLFLVQFYQGISKPLFTALGISSVCRFRPTCSVYMYEVVRRYGTIDGFAKGMVRFLRCHPFSSGGYDPVR